MATRAGTSYNPNQVGMEELILQEGRGHKRGKKQARGMATPMDDQSSTVLNRAVETSGLVDWRYSRAWEWWS